MDSVGSGGSGEGGNTISPSPQRISPSVRWSLTLNNFTECDVGSMVTCFNAEAKYAIVGKEVGEGGTPHLQGYVEFKRKLRPLSLNLPKGIHWEKSKGNRESNYTYCTKDNDIAIAIGVPKPIKLIENLYWWQKEIIEEIKNDPDDRTINWIWSEQGGVGKTSFQKYLVIKHNAIVLGGKASDCRNGILEFHKKNGNTPNLVCINVPRCFNADYVSYEAYENIKDMIFYSGKYEGGMVCGNCPHLFIFANFSPDVEKMSDDRWRIKCID